MGKGGSMEKAAGKIKNRRAKKVKADSGLEGPSSQNYLANEKNRLKGEKRMGQTRRREKEEVLNKQGSWLETWECIKGREELTISLFAGKTTHSIRMKK